MTDPFRSRRLVYRAIDNRPQDAAFLSSLRQDSIAMMLADASLTKPPGKKSDENFVQLLENCLLAVIICLPEDAGSELSGGAFSPKSIGVIAVGSPSPHLVQHRAGEITGFAIDRQFRGKGYGTEALRWTIDWAFSHANLNRVGIGCFAHNVAAEEVYKSVGFVCEGRKREAMWNDGAYRDLILFSMLRKEWTPQTPA